MYLNSWVVLKGLFLFCVGLRGVETASRSTGQFSAPRIEPERGSGVAHSFS
jgi:hypothetical protein